MSKQPTITVNEKSYTRKGVESSVRLCKTINEIDDSDETSCNKVRKAWEDIEKYYLSMLKEKVGEELVELDQYCEDLIANFENCNVNQDTTNLHIGSEGLTRIVKWKFGKGKPRYALWKHLNSNTDDFIHQSSRNAFAMVHTTTASLTSDDVDDNVLRSAMDELTKLKGVGPATASAILSLVRPDLFVFMDDTVIESLYEGKRDYTNKIYFHINSQCILIAHRLGDGWTARRVGKIIWTAAHMSNSSTCKDKIEEILGGLVGTSSSIGADETVSNSTDDVHSKQVSQRERKRQKR